LSASEEDFGAQCRQVHAGHWTSDY
jgi:hypothetical protein